ncbi:aromatic amino acid exporter YddG [Arenimonas caeni]|uniref:EamA family transporter n=1 Tax=Arenimonas caeni TaxID=2058085 RepID=A0A2P6MCJ8_9GAMM|nr:EamA family transporter [Arenimonas caeni]MDY0022920.1 EamA family transporter [Arenimonas caeni]PRH83715.1 EamA family transporter [Arenimonas caeni]
MSPRARATGAGFGAVLLWSTLAVLTTATEGIPPFQLLALGFGFAGVAGTALLLRPGGPGLAALRQPPAAALLCIGALFGYHALFFLALKRAPVVEANLLNYLWPLLIVVFAALLGGSRVRAGQWLGTALGLAAAVLLVTRGGRLDLDARHALGYAAAIGAALTWGLYSVLNRRFGDVPSQAMAGACLAVAVLGGLVHLAVETSVAPTPAQWLAIALLGLGPTGAAFWLWDIGTKRGDLATLGTLSYAAPLLSTGWLLLAGQARPHWSQAVALALLVGGAWLGVRGGRRA